MIDPIYFLNQQLLDQLFLSAQIFFHLPLISLNEYDDSVFADQRHVAFELIQLSKIFFL